MPQPGRPELPPCHEGCGDDCGLPPLRSTSAGSEAADPLRCASLIGGLSDRALPHRGPTLLAQAPTIGAAE